MANKRNREIWAKEEKERKYKVATKGLTIYPVITLIITAVVILLFFLKWAYVYNTDMKGAEVSFSGFNAIFATLGGDFSSVSHGDISMPFYYDAKDYTVALGALTVIAIAIIIANIVVLVVAMSTKAYVLNGVSFILSALEFILLIACFIVALSMKNGTILSRYCSGNPACSIKSLAIIPAIVALISAVPSAIACKKYFAGKKLLK